ncbi:hypothetical protein [Desulfotruncus arcticus]|uniref:hypothetical protein n=1 Tax=Desulfotruncus arcticus TaxID=341036 RepID=UPI0010423BC3|nr:hypothetical protein [Desulfotruncus arcticus]
MRSDKVSNRDKKIAVKGFVKQLQYDPVENMLHIYFWPSPVDQASPMVTEALKSRKAGDNSSPTFPALGGGDTRI